jgi:hypothetical protein
MHVFLYKKVLSLQSEIKVEEDLLVETELQKLDQLKIKKQSKVSHFLPAHLHPLPPHLQTTAGQSFYDKYKQATNNAPPNGR